MRISSCIPPIALSLCISLGVSAEERDLRLNCVGFNTTLNSQGFIESLSDGRGAEYLLKKPPSPLLRLKTFKGEKLENPRRMTWSQQRGFKQLRLDFGKSVAVIRAVEKLGYLTLEVTDLEGEEAELIFWGPYHVTIREKIGSSLGVAYDDNYAIGIMGLNIKTCGGYRTKADSYRGNVVVGINGGAMLQAHARNRTKRGTFTYGRQKHIEVTPLEGETAEGTKLAFYGTATRSLMPLISRIETQEGLPHPLHEGEWLKTSRYATSSKLITNFREDTFDSFLDLAARAGISCIYQPDVFQSWGTFEIKRGRFPGGMSALKTLVAKARAHGITLGTHTLSNFIQTTDPLVTPVPHPGLLRAGVTTLKEGLDAESTTIVLADDAPIEAYDRQSRGEVHAVQIGDELIEFSSRSGRRPWTLTGCKRGAFGTRIATHTVGARAAKIVSHSYGVFLPGIELQDEMAANLARFFNISGFERMSFDGLEGCLRTGQGRYAEERFFKVFFDHLDNKNIVCNSSQLPHYSWHYSTNESWGEPWVGGFRQSMLDHRLRAQKFLVLNKLPSKLGQFRIGPKTTVEDIDWVMNLCAGLDSGVDFYIEPSVFTKNPSGEELVETIKRWETSRMAGIFTEEEKAELRKPSTIFTLVPDGGRLKLKFVHDWVKAAAEKRERKMTLMKDVFGGDVRGSKLTDDFEHVNKPREPGQPTSANWTLQNDARPHPLQFVMRADRDNDEPVRNAWFKIGAITCGIPFEIGPGGYVVARGDGKASLYSATGKLLAEKALRDLTLVQGHNEISFNTHRDGVEPGPKAIINFKTYLEGHSLTTGRPVTSSSNAAKASLVNDGKMNDSRQCWQTGAGKRGSAWWQVDLEGVETVSRIVVAPYLNGRRYYQYRVETSLDGADWTTTIDRSGNTSLVPKKGYGFDIEPTRMRYIRVRMLKHSANGIVHLVEVMAF